MKDATEIIILLDRSGSMESCREDTIGGFNTFVQDQRAVPGDCRLTFIQFDTHAYEVMCANQPIADVAPLSKHTFKPRGGTPLLDAMARTIDEMGQRLAWTPEVDRPAKVIFVTITDGLENASRRFSRQEVFFKVKHQTEKYGWQFVYLGANQDAIAVAHDIGISGMRAMSYDVRNTVGTYSVASDFVTRSRGATGMASFTSNSFTPGERAQAAGEIVSVTVTTDSAGGTK